MDKQEWLNQKDIYTGISLREAIRQRVPFTRYFSGMPIAKKAGKLSAIARAQIKEMRAAAKTRLF